MSICLLFQKAFLKTCYIVKFRFSKKAKNFETIFHMIWRFLSKCQIKWKTVSNFCGLFRMSELLYVTAFRPQNFSHCSVICGLLNLPRLLKVRQFGLFLSLARQLCSLCFLKYACKQPTLKYTHLSLSLNIF